MEKLLLIDGHSILNRAYYGLPLMSNKEGLHTNAVYGFLNIMMKFIDEKNPDYLAVAFDTSAPTFRHKMYKEYKGTRKGMDPELREQVPVIQEMLTLMQIPIIKVEGIEADDILGTLAKKYAKEGLFVEVVSGDRDLLQLCDETIRICIPKTKRTGTEVEEYLAKDVEEKIGVSPLEYIDVKALMGDKSDNIPGVAGIGEKGALGIISKFKSIENAYNNIDEVMPKGAAAKLKDQYESAVMSKELATIKTDCELTFNLDDSRLNDPYTREAKVLCEKLELKSFLKRFPKEMESDAKNESAKNIDIVSIDSDKGILGLSFDEEFVGVSCSMDEIFIAAGNTVYEIKGSPGEVIGHLISNSECVLCHEDVKSLLTLLSNPGQILPGRFFDATIAEYLLEPTRSTYEIIPQGSTKKDAAIILYNKAYELKESLISTDMYKLFSEVEMPLCFTLFDMEKEGIYLDKDKLSEYNSMLTENLLKFEEEIYAECGEVFNINSPKQLGEILFEKMGLPGAKKTKTGYSTAADVLEKLASDYPIVSKILLYRQYAKLKSTYAEGLMDCVASDGRIHTSFQQTVTATGRLSSTNPNLQNIPIRTDLGRQIRKAFIPKPGYVFIDADYSQIELRVLAHMSKDENLIKAYRENKDIHRATAAKVFNKPFDEVTDRERSNAKAVNFGIVYGISSFGLGMDLNISRKEAQQYIDDYYKAYPTLKLFLDSLIERAKSLGYTLTMFGRRRPVMELTSRNFMQRSFGERICMNTPIQGSAADIIKIAMNRVHARLKAEGLKSRLILQVHDELLIEAAIEEKDKVLLLLKEEMENACELSVPLISEVHTGSDWYEAK